jgi:hypothetical protein
VEKAMIEKVRDSISFINLKSKIWKLKARLVIESISFIFLKVMSSLFELIRSTYSRFAKIRDSNPWFAFGALIVANYIIINYTMGYQDASIEKWTKTILMITIIGFFSIYMLFWIKWNNKYQNEKNRELIKTFLRGFSGIFVMGCIFVSLFSLLLPKIAILVHIGFVFAVGSSISLIIVNISDGSTYTSEDSSTILKRLRKSSQNGECCIIYPDYVKSNGSLKWNTTSIPTTDNLVINPDRKESKPLTNFPVSESGVFFRISQTETTPQYYTPATEIELIKFGILPTYESHNPETIIKIKRKSLSHLLIATMSSETNRWGRYSISAMIRGQISFRLESNSYVSYSWKRQDIADTASYIKNELIFGNENHPIKKWFRAISNKSVNNEVLSRYLSILSKFESSKLFGKHKWDATIDGFSLVCKIAETASDSLKIPSINSIIQNEDLDLNVHIIDNFEFSKRIEIGELNEESFFEFSKYETSVLNSPVEEFVRLHDEILAIALSNLEKDDHSLMEFLERVIQRMMEKIHQTKHLEGRDHRKNQLIDRREGLIAGTVLGLKAVFQSLKGVND